MKIKIVLLLFIAFFSLAGYSQISTTNFQIKNKAPLYEISVNADNLEEIKNLDWEMIRNISKTIAKDATLDSLKLKITYKNPVMLAESKLDDFSYEVVGLKSEMETLIAKSKNTVS